MISATPELLALKCFYCHEVLSCGPVLLTALGDNVCGRCRAPTKPEYLFLRNVAYERAAAKYIFPCKHSRAGCPAQLSMDNAKFHEENCSYKNTRYGCPTASLDARCPWEGPASELEAHYSAAHPELRAKHPYTDKPDIKKPPKRASNLLMSVYGFLFVVQLKFADAKLWYSVRLVGLSSLEKLFKFTAKFSKGEACLMKPKEVASSDRFELNREHCIYYKINSLFEDLGNYDDLDFELWVTMRDVQCHGCGRKLDRAPIYPTMTEGSFSCEDCHQEVPSSTTCSQETQTEEITPERTNAESRTIWWPVQCSACVRELQWSPAVPRGNEGPLCSPCHAQARFSPTWVTCWERAKGCQYGSAGVSLLLRHQELMCSYSDWRCGMCGAGNTGRGTREIDHYIQKHCTLLTPVFSGGSATVTATVTWVSDTWSYFTTSIHGVVFMLVIQTTADSLLMGLTTDSECRGWDVFRGTYKITSPNSQHEINGELSEQQISVDWYSVLKINQFFAQSQICVTVILGRKKCI